MPLRVTILGGGPAAAELLLALRSAAAERVALQLVAPHSRLPLRAVSTGAAFGAAAMEVYDIARLADETGADLVIDQAEAVAPKARQIRLRSGRTTSYDVLVIAVGARARAAVPGATTFRDHRDALMLRNALAQHRADQPFRIVFAAPSGVAWTLPLYELALLASGDAARHGVDADVTLVTPERRALEVFGPSVSARIEQILADRGIRVLTRSAATGVLRGRLNLTRGRSLATDRVIAVPRLVGRELAGIPTDWNGFVPTDRWGRVLELTDVFAAGDVTAGRIKQGGIATQQADTIAAVIAARIGSAPPPPSPRYVLRARFFGPEEPLYLRAELDEEGRALPSTAAPVSSEAPWWPAGKIVGRHLTPWMAGHEPEEVLTF